MSKCVRKKMILRFEFNEQYTKGWGGGGEQSQWSSLLSLAADPALHTLAGHAVSCICYVCISYPFLSLTLQVSLDWGETTQGVHHNAKVMAGANAVATHMSPPPQEAIKKSN